MCPCHPIAAMRCLAAAFTLALGPGRSGAGEAPGAAPPSMRDLMRSMTRGQVPPPGMTPESLPDPDTPGARLVARYCAQCHDLPSPRYRTAAEWPAVLDRMLGRVRTMQGDPMHERMMGTSLLAPDTGETRVIRAYLTDHAMIPATGADLGRGWPEDAASFRAACAQRHVPPSPSLHRPEDWPATVAHMEANIRQLGKRGLSPAQRQAVLRFLRQASSPVSTPRTSL